MKRVVLVWSVFADGKLGMSVCVVIIMDFSVVTFA